VGRSGGASGAGAAGAGGSPGGGVRRKPPKALHPEAPGSFRRGSVASPDGRPMASQEAPGRRGSAGLFPSKSKKALKGYPGAKSSLHGRRMPEPPAPGPGPGPAPAILSRPEIIKAPERYNDSLALWITAALLGGQKMLAPVQAQRQPPCCRLRTGASSSHQPEQAGGPTAPQPPVAAGSALP
jgi:hypothetical protein